jgi:hypothetical protein
MRDESESSGAKRTILCRSIFLLLVIMPLAGGPLQAALEEGDVPEHVKVQGVFFVPLGEERPAKDQMLKLLKHYPKAVTGRC